MPKRRNRAHLNQPTIYNDENEQSSQQSPSTQKKLSEKSHLKILKKWKKSSKMAHSMTDSPQIIQMPQKGFKKSQLRNATAMNEKIKEKNRLFSSYKAEKISPKNLQGRRNNFDDGGEIRPYSSIPVQRTTKISKLAKKTKFTLKSHPTITESRFKPTQVQNDKNKHRKKKKRT